MLFKFSKWRAAVLVTLQLALCLVLWQGSEPSPSMPTAAAGDEELCPMRDCGSNHCDVRGDDNFVFCIRKTTAALVMEAEARRDARSEPNRDRPLQNGERGSVLDWTEDFCCDRATSPFPGLAKPIDGADWRRTLNNFKRLTAGPLSRWFTDWYPEATCGTPIGGGTTRGGLAADGTFAIDNLCVGAAPPSLRGFRPKINATIASLGSELAVVLPLSRFSHNDYRSIRELGGPDACYVTRPAVVIHAQHSIGHTMHQIAPALNLAHTLPGGPNNTIFILHPSQDNRPEPRSNWRELQSSLFGALTPNIFSLAVEDLQRPAGRLAGHAQYAPATDDRTAAEATQVCFQRVYFPHHCADKENCDPAAEGVPGNQHSFPLHGRNSPERTARTIARMDAGIRHCLGLPAQVRRARPPSLSRSEALHILFVTRVSNEAETAAYRAVTTLHLRRLGHRVTHFYIRAATLSEIFRALQGVDIAICSQSTDSVFTYFLPRHAVIFEGEAGNEAFFSELAPTTDRHGPIHGQHLQFSERARDLNRTFYAFVQPTGLFDGGRQGGAVIPPRFFADTVLAQARCAWRHYAGPDVGFDLRGVERQCGASLPWDFLNSTQFGHADLLGSQVLSVLAGWLDDLRPQKSQLLPSLRRSGVAAAEALRAFDFLVTRVNVAVIGAALTKEELNFFAGVGRYRARAVAVCRLNSSHVSEFATQCAPVAEVLVVTDEASAEVLGSVGDIATFPRLQALLAFANASEPREWWDTRFLSRLRLRASAGTLGMRMAGFSIAGASARTLERTTPDAARAELSHSTDVRVLRNYRGHNEARGNWPTKKRK